MSEGKNQHIEFAYYALPEVFRGQTEQFFEYLDRDGVAFLEFWWNQVGNRIGEEYPQDSDGIAYEVKEQEDGTKIVLITLPAPKNDQEAYYIALVHPRQKKTFLKWQNLPRVFSFSLSLKPGNAFKTLFGEWTPRGRYVHISSNTTKPSLEIFYTAVKEQLKK